MSTNTMAGGATGTCETACQGPTREFHRLQAPAPSNYTFHEHQNFPTSPSRAPTTLAAAISRGEGELVALRSAVRTVEGTLAAERLRVAELKHRTINVRQPHHEHASHAQTLLQKLEEERRQRRELRTRLAAAAR